MTPDPDQVREGVIALLAEIFDQPEQLRDWLPLAEHGRCTDADPDAFFPAQGEMPPVEICESCYVKEACRDFAYRYDERWGTWGGHGQAVRKRARQTAKEHAA